MLILLLVVVIVAIIFEYISLNTPINHVLLRMEPTKRCVEPGEAFVLDTVVENKSKYNFISLLQIEVRLPKSINLCNQDDGKLETWSDDDNSLFFQMSLKKNQKITRKAKISIDKRGIYHIREGRIIFGDFLGFNDRVRVVNQNQSVIVYPRKMSDSRILQVLDDVSGEVMVQDFLLKEPTLVRGYRDYTGYEPMKMINFMQSARTDELVVKEYDSTKQETVNIVFDATFLGDFDNYYFHREVMFSIVRTLVESFEDRDLAYRLVMNSYYEAANHYGVNVMESDGNGGNQLVTILEALSAASGVMVRTEELLNYVVENFQYERVFVYVAHHKNEENEAVLRRFTQEHGITLHTLYAEDFVDKYIEDLK